MNLCDCSILKERKQISVLIDEGHHVMTLNNGATFFELYSPGILCETGI